MTHERIVVGSSDLGRGRGGMAKRSKVKVTRSRDVSTDKNAITRQCVVISTSNLVGIIDVGVDACGILSRSVGQKTGSRNMADIQNIKCKNQRKTSPNRRNFAF